MAGGKKSKKRRPAGRRPPAAQRPQPGRQPAAKQGPARGPSAPRKPTRAERLEAARRARRRKALAVRLGIAAVVAALLGALAVKLVSDRREAAAAESRLTKGSCDVDTRSDPTDRAGANHVPNATYRVDPPAGGNHDPEVAGSDTDLYGEGGVPPDGQLVHALEHGYVIFWHRPDISQGDREAIQEVADRYDRDVLVVPRPSLRPPVAATAWGNRLLCRNVEPDALDLFTRSYRNKGPEKVPHE